MNSYVIGINETCREDIEMVGGKGANLGELTRISSILVPDGFCVTRNAFTKALDGNIEFNNLLGELSKVNIDDLDKISELSNKVQITINKLLLPIQIYEEVLNKLNKYGINHAYAVRSSATFEDSILNSFAGQQDSYLNIIGIDAILSHIKKCWASLYNERAIIYRIRNDFSHRKVTMSVVVQRMVFPQVSGVMFTADPITNNHKVLTINASYGLGETIVLGLIEPDSYTVIEGEIKNIKVGTKKLAMNLAIDGGTKEEEIKEEDRVKLALTKEQIIELYRIGRRIEEHFGYPQDIEWCYKDSAFYIVQSRPITTLYPVPKSEDNDKHVYISVGHQQMMTDAMKPLGSSIFQLTSFGPRYLAGGRLFIDVTHMLKNESSQAMLLESMGQHDPLIKDALLTIIEQDYITIIPSIGEADNKSTPIDPMESLLQVEYDKTIVSGLMLENEKSQAELKEKIEMKSGIDLIELIKEDIMELKRMLTDPISSNIYTQAIHATKWVNDRILEWLGEENVADILSQSVPNNITSQMGIDLMKLADEIRPFKEVIHYLQRTKDENFLDNLNKLPGGDKVYITFKKFLERYGMRCSGEIDITNPRWKEKPTSLIPMILNNVNNSLPKAGDEKFEQGRIEAKEKEEELIKRVKALDNGEKKGNDLKRMIDLIRNYIGYREFPKYMIVNRYNIYKKALLKEASKLSKDNVIKELEDIYYLTLEELQEVILTKKLNYNLISKRKEEHEFFKSLIPPRVITSDGEVIHGKYHMEHIPKGALPGLAVSKGIVEGPARIVINMEDAKLLPGDILVTTFTDPSWTSLFVSIKGLVTEVGGLMTHGAVIAREYGLPAVVGVEHATKLIKDGQYIRVHGSKGYVEILDKNE